MIGVRLKRQIASEPESEMRFNLAQRFPVGVHTLNLVFLLSDIVKEKKTQSKLTPDFYAWLRLVDRKLR